jgi:hypothetical protein
MCVFLFANRRRLSGGCADAAREGAGIGSHPRAEILASCAAQHAASSRPMPDAETALLLYDRYFSGRKTPAGERLSRLALPRAGTALRSGAGVGLECEAAGPD